MKRIPKIAVEIGISNGNHVRYSCTFLYPVGNASSGEHVVRMYQSEVRQIDLALDGRMDLPALSSVEQAVEMNVVPRIYYFYRVRIELVLS